jgi:cell division septation protein DedD
MRRWITIILIACSGSVYAGFSESRSVTIDHTKCGSSDSTNFPVLVNSIDTGFKTVANGGHVQNVNGYDIRPYADAALTTALDYELERYNPVTGEVVIWVLIPTVSHTSDTVFYVAYGDATLVTDGSTTATWSNGYVGVYHLKNGITISVSDSTGNHNGTNHGVTATTGQIDGSGSFASASSDYVDCGSITGAASQTLSAWINIASLPHSYNAIAGKNGSNPFIFFVKSNAKLAMFSGSIYDGTGTNTLSLNTWYYICMVSSGGSPKLIGYVNGSVDNTASSGSGPPAGSIQTDIGQDPVNANRFFNGIIDEVHVSNVARSADWITTEYNNQNDPGTFYTLGSEATPTPTPTATFTPTPTATATFTPTPTASPTASPSATSTATPTPTLAAPTPTPTSIPSAQGFFYLTY